MLVEDAEPTGVKTVERANGCDLVSDGWLDMWLAWRILIFAIVI